MKENANNVLGTYETNNSKITYVSIHVHTVDVKRPSGMEMIKIIHVLLTIQPLT